jgi:hypothetical protein
MIEGRVRQSDNRWRVEGEVNVPVCLQWACHMYRGGKHQGSMLTRERGFAIFGKRVRSCTTIVRRPIADPRLSDRRWQRRRSAWSRSLTIYFERRTKNLEFIS